MNARSNNRSFTSNPRSPAAQLTATLARSPIRYEARPQHRLNDRTTELFQDLVDLRAKFREHQNEQERLKLRHEAVQNELFNRLLEKMRNIRDDSARDHMHRWTPPIDVDDDPLFTAPAQRISPLYDLEDDETIEEDLHPTVERDVARDSVLGTQEYTFNTRNESNVGKLSRRLFEPDSSAPFSNSSQASYQPSVLEDDIEEDEWTDGQNGSGSLPTPEKTPSRATHKRKRVTSPARAEAGPSRPAVVLPSMGPPAQKNVYRLSSKKAIYQPPARKAAEKARKRNKKTYEWFDEHGDPREQSVSQALESGWNPYRAYDTDQDVNDVL